MKTDEPPPNSETNEEIPVENAEPSIAYEQKLGVAEDFMVELTLAISPSTAHVERSVSLMNVI